MQPCVIPHFLDNARGIYPGVRKINNNDLRQVEIQKLENFGFGGNFALTEAEGLQKQIEEQFRVPAEKTSQEETDELLEDLGQHGGRDRVSLRDLGRGDLPLDAAPRHLHRRVQRIARALLEVHLSSVSKNHQIAFIYPLYVYRCSQLTYVLLFYKVCYYICIAIKMNKNKDY